MVSVEVEEVEVSTTVAGFRVALRPEREPTPVRFTSPEKPFNPVTVISEVPEDPAWTVREEGLVAIVKPVTWTLTEAEREIAPVIPVPVPVTVTVYAPGETDV